MIAGTGWLGSKTGGFGAMVEKDRNQSFGNKKRLDLVLKALIGGRE
jgi:hypothetical protein